MYPPGLEEIVVHALQHRPEDRFGSTDEMRVALEDWLVGARRIVTQEDVAETLATRMEPAKLAYVKKLRSRPKRSLQHSYNALLDAFDENEPPTAASGVVVPPGDLMRKSRSIPPSQASNLLNAVAGAEGDVTVRTEVDATAPDGAVDQSGWYRTGEHDLNTMRDVSRQEATKTEVTGPRAPSNPPEKSALSDTPHSGTSSPLLVQALLSGLIVVAVLWFLLR
jgi:hypothetical protein